MAILACRLTFEASEPGRSELSLASARQSCRPVVRGSRGRFGPSMGLISEANPAAASDIAGPSSRRDDRQNQDLSNAAMERAVI